MNKVVHFEIPFKDPELGMEFFRNVFGWKFHQMGNEDYWFTESGDADEGGIEGAFMKKRDPDQPITNSIEVASIREKASLIESNGGEIVVPKTPVPGMGWFAFFKDPDGNIHGLWEADKNAV